MIIKRWSQNETKLMISNCEGGMKKETNMRSKQHQNINFKPLILLGFLFIFLLFLKLGSNFSSNIKNPQKPSYSSCPSCQKIPPSLAEGIVHYASTNITPQQTYKEIGVALEVLERRSPCNFLVFGLGNDSLMWSLLNYGGRTVFLEESEGWMKEVKQFMPSVEAYHVKYDKYTVGTAVEALQENLKDEECREVNDPRLSKCNLAIRTFPDEIYNTEWDVIMIDAPTGFKPTKPGRMTAIYTAGLMARNRKSGETDIFVHDINRWVENKFSMTFLCEGYWKGEIGGIRHFTIPTHRVWLQKPFCP